METNGQGNVWDVGKDEPKDVISDTGMSRRGKLDVSDKR